VSRRVVETYGGAVAQLPLFPLGTVLVPGAQLPLQIFEPRYLELLSDLVNAMDVPEFGVVAIRQGHEVGADAVRDLHEVGCVARVSHAAPVGDGRYFVLSTGTERFHLDALAPVGTAYLTGEVTVLEERAGDAEEVARPADRLR
jgi:Lon protease-like protein